MTPEKRSHFMCFFFCEKQCEMKTLKVACTEKIFYIIWSHSVCILMNFPTKFEVSEILNNFDFLTRIDPVDLPIT